jgi:adenylate cyclase
VTARTVELESEFPVANPSKTESRITAFVAELKRRKVVRFAVAYLLAGWVLIQIADATAEPLHLPEWTETLVVWLVGLGFPAAVILAWLLDVTPSGIAVTPPADGDEPARKEARSAASAPSIAVLPFVNVSGIAENEYFSDGLSEELLNVLSRVPDLRVCSRTSSFVLKNKDMDMATVAEKLGVSHVLEGSIRRLEDRVRINAQLVNAREDRHLWSETYDRELRDIFELQSEIASSIVSALKLTLTSANRRALHSTTSNVKAYDYYLRGRELYHRTESGHLQQSREMFEESIRIDPEYALAYAGLTYCYVDTYWYSDKDTAWIDQAQQSSRKAVELAPHLAESHTARGLAHRVSERFEEAEAEFEKAIAINPRLFEPIHFYAQMVRSLGDYDRAAILFGQAADARPEDYQARAIQATMYQAIGNNALAREAASMTIAAARQAFELNPSDSRALILGAAAQLTLGNRETALEWAALAQQTNPESNGVAYNTACIFARLGESDKALELIERAVELGSRNKRYFEHDPDLESIREHPRFKALLKTI